MKLLITAGPTHEYLDAVRFLGNPSTGAMGLAVAEAARDRGHQPLVVLGPSPLPDPPKIEVRRVVSALDMRQAVLEWLPEVQALVACAAVLDYRPRVRVAGKIKKGSPARTLELVKNPDILEEVGRIGGRRPLVGFALETGSGEDALKAARAKLLAKRCSLMVLNRPGSFQASRLEAVTLVFPDKAVFLGRPSKRALGDRLVVFLEERLGEQRA